MRKPSIIIVIIMFHHHGCGFMDETKGRGEKESFSVVVVHGVFYAMNIFSILK
jgi:hypothetical protein